MAFLAALNSGQPALRKTSAPKETNLEDRLGGLQIATSSVTYLEARTLAKVQPVDAPPPTVKILVLQRNCVSPEELDQILHEEATATGRPADFMILPEGAHHEGGEIKDNVMLRQLAAVVKKHAVYACLGTMGEKAEGQNIYHCTALIVGPSGDLVATYRKRATLGMSQTPGLSPVTFDTKFGKVGIMICYDAENKDFVAEALAEDPVLMLNPIHISAGAISAGDGSDMTQQQQQRNLRWRTSLESMGRHIDHLVSQSGVTWVRCDQPFPCGAGTSQVTSSAFTQQVPEKGATNWSVVVPLKGANGSSWIARPPPRDRTAEIDNCGNRYTLKNTVVNVDARPGAALKFRYAKPNRECPRGMVQILQIDNEGGHIVATTTVDLFRMMTLAKSKQGSSVDGHDAQSPIVGVVPGQHLSFSGEDSTFFIDIDHHTMRLMYHGSAAQDGSVGCCTEDGQSQTNLPVPPSVPSCHHVFLGPSAGIAAAAYFQDPGVIVTLSHDRSHSSTRTDLLQELDGVYESKRRQNGRQPKMIFTVWECMQHRHPAPLHELLR